jgi:hypothetical protein
MDDGTPTLPGARSKKAGSELGVGVLGYNIKRTIQILGPNQLIEAMKAYPG